jgi:uncharacterized membrane protein
MVVRPEGFQQVSHALNIAGTPIQTLWAVKLMLRAVDFFLTSFNFTLAIRYFNHAGYGPGLLDTPAGRPFTIGMRCYDITIPLGLWIFGPTWMLMGSIILVMVLYRLNRTA